MATRKSSSTAMDPAVRERLSLERERLLELSTESAETAEGYELILDELEALAPDLALIPAPDLLSRRRPDEPRPRGRPTRQETLARLAQSAPIPDLVLVAADQVGSVLRHQDDPARLRQAHTFEARYCRRRTVLAAIAARLRALGEPVGGPVDPPLPYYEELDTAAVLSELRRRHNSVQFAAHVFAYEHYRERRRDVLREARRLAGKQAATTLVQETAPVQIVELPEPFPGYGQLSAHPSGRARVRELFAHRTPKELAAAHVYELQTKARTTILAALDRAIRQAVRH
jgi:hypothetical protein